MIGADGLTDKVRDYVKSHKLVLETSSDGFWIWDLDNPECEYISPRFWESFGVDYREMPHSPSSWQNLIHPDDKVTAINDFHEHIDSKGRKPYHLTVRYKHSDGYWVYVICRGQAMFDSGLMVGCHQNISTHITERHKIIVAAEKLRKQALETIQVLEKLRNE